MRTLLSLAVSRSLALTAVPVGATTQAALRKQVRELLELTPAPDDALSRALNTGTLSDAEYALERGLSLFAPRPVTPPIRRSDVARAARCDRSSS